MNNTYKPGTFAKLINRTVNTLQRWDREGILKAHRSPTGRRFYTHDQYLEYLGLVAKGEGKVIAYARVSSVGQKPDLKNQIEALKKFCLENKIIIDELIQEIGSGLNYKRKKFNDIFQQIELGKVSKLIIAHKDRLVRFGFEWFESFCKRHGAELIIINGDSLSPEQELVQDLLSIVHDFSARLYGLQSYKKVIKNAAMQKDKNQS